MDTYSYLRGYARERSVIESLAARARGGEIALFGGLFLDLAESYLHTEFNQTKADGRHAIMMYVAFLARLNLRSSAKASGEQHSRSSTMCDTKAAVLLLSPVADGQEGACLFSEQGDLADTNLLELVSAVSILAPPPLLCGNAGHLDRPGVDYDSAGQHSR